jgi:AraC-like DNA-binding protein
MEKTAFSRFFTRTVGITFHDFVQQWRVAVAVDRMMTTDNSLTEIAFATGFQSMITFERAFKKLTGMPPSEFRRDLLCREGISVSQELITKTHRTMTQGNERASSSSGN